jgi:hypothetical protein
MFFFENFLPVTLTWQARVTHQVNNTRQDTKKKVKTKESPKAKQVKESPLSDLVKARFASVAHVRTYRRNPSEIGANNARKSQLTKISKSRLSKIPHLPKLKGSVPLKQQRTDLVSGEKDDSDFMPSTVVKDFALLQTESALTPPFVPQQTPLNIYNQGVLDAEAEMTKKLALKVEMGTDRIERRAAAQVAKSSLMFSDKSLFRVFCSGGS